jgi:hypothetical protein
MESLYSKAFKSHDNEEIKVQIDKEVKIKDKPYKYRGAFHYFRETDDENHQNYILLIIKVSIKDRSLLSIKGKSQVDIYYDNIKAQEIIARNIKSMLNNIKSTEDMEDYLIRTMKKYTEIAVLIKIDNFKYLKKLNIN